MTIVEAEDHRPSPHVASLQMVTTGVQYCLLVEGRYYLGDGTALYYYDDHDIAALAARGMQIRLGTPVVVVTAPAEVRRIDSVTPAINGEQAINQIETEMVDGRLPICAVVEIGRAYQKVIHRHQSERSQ
jgi:hypothetical protein